MKWVVAIFAVLVLADIVNALTYSGPGFFITSNCNNITNPVTNATVCWQTSTAGLFYWNGTAFVNAIGSTMVSTIPTPPPCTIYAVPNGGSGTSCSSGTPCTIAQAMMNATHPGDRVCVNDGTVSTYVSGFGMINASATGGTLSKPVWITPTNYQTLITGATTMNQPKVLVSLAGQGPNVGGIVFSGTSNVVVAGFEIAGTGSEASNERGIFMRANVFNDGTNHQYAYNNLIHDLGGGGISCNFMDYCTIQGNIVYNTGGQEADCGSNISVYTPIASDGNAGCHITVAGNISHDSKEAGGCSDGEGIILDDFDHTQTDNVPYTQMGCVENNLLYNNISDGIEVFEGVKGSVKRIRNNTTYNNATDPRDFGGQGARAEIIGLIATNMEVANNIVQPSTTGNAGLSVGLSEHASPAGSTVYVGNMCWAPGGQNCWWSGTGGDVNPFASNYFNVNPQWINPPTDFRLTAASPAINAGYNNYAQPTTDILSFVRPNRMDLGAYLGLQ